MKIVLVVNGRIPGPRAHTITTMRTAVGLWGHGLDVEVWAPRRQGSSGADPPRETTPQQWYGLPVDIPVRYLDCFDFVDVAPRWMQRVTAPVLARSFARAFVRAAEGMEAMFVLRDPWLWSQAADRLEHWAAEVHELPRREEKRAQARRALQKAAAVWTISGTGREVVRREGLEREIGVLACPVPESWLSFPSSREEARAEIGIANDTPLVAYAGNLHAWKAPGRILAAARALPGTAFRIVGGLPADREALARRAPENVHFAGFAPPHGVPLELRAADVVLVSLDAADERARCFTSPLKVLEALALGTPLVAPDLPTIRELVGDPPAAWIFDPEREGEPAATIQRACAEPERAGQRARAGRHRAATFSESERARQLLALLAIPAKLGGFPTNRGEA